jgi:hypothetical protein
MDVEEAITAYCSSVIKHFIDIGKVTQRSSIAMVFAQYTKTFITENTALVW